MVNGEIAVVTAEIGHVNAEIAEDERRVSATSPWSTTS
jgi:hypothetical protein